MGRWRATRLVIGGIVLAGSLAIAWASRLPGLFGPQEPGSVQPATYQDIVGFPNRVDALSLLPLAEKLTPYRRLSRWMAVGVTSEGALDLTTGQSGARFEFYDFLPQAGSSNGKASTAHCGRQTVQLTGRGLYGDPALPLVSCELFGPRGLPQPACTLRQVWQKAIKDGADPSFPAVIEYLFIQEKPVWRFSHLRQDFTRIYPPDCR